MIDEERLLRLLVRRGRLTREKQEDALRERKASGRPLPEILIERSIVTPGQLEDAIAAIQSKILHCARCSQRIYNPALEAGQRRCAWCGGPVEWRDGMADNQGPDFDSILDLTQEELPAEVRVVRSVAGRRFGKYILLTELGRGGSGIVQKAWDTVLGEYVALKFVREPESGQPTSDESEMATKEMTVALLQEARTALRLQHGHIVPIRDIGMVGRQVYISMDFVEGRTLADHVRKAKEAQRLSCFYEDPEYYLGVVCDIADAIHYAHTFPRPLVHCDLKPGNVMISEAGTAYVLDFGLARLLDLPASEDTSLRGTPGYMAPEQIAGQDQNVGVWTDVYGIGAILYELLAGRATFTGQTLFDISIQTMNDAPARPTQLLQKSSEVRRPGATQLLAMVTMLETICLKCLAKDPRQRYGSAVDIEEELEGVLEAIDAGDFGPYVRSAGRRA